MSIRFFETAAPGSSGNRPSGDLPRWDLSDLYESPESERLKADMAAIEADVGTFRSAYLGRVTGLDGAGLGLAVAAYESISERFGKIASYAQLLYATDVTDPAVAAFQQGILEKSAALSSQLVFFTLELNQIDDTTMKERLEAPEFARYAPWIRDLALMRDHQLSDELERLFNEKDISGRAAWVRLYDETLARLRFQVGNETLTLTETQNRLSDADPARRREAARSLGERFGAELPLFAHITNTLAVDKRVDDAWRSFPTPLSSRNLSNRLEDNVVEALVDTVRGAYPRISHRYYALKAKWFGVDQLNYWDRNAPLPESDETLWSWDEACSLVREAYEAFSPDMARVADNFFTRAWIDVPPSPGKASGAFAHPVVPSAHPYLLLNFMGRTRDVMTLAHELGHGVHQVLAARQGALLSETPLTLAETASVFGEMLTFRRLLDRTTDPARKRVLLAGKVEDMINTVVRQIAFHTFELAVHTERQNGEIPADRLCAIWMDVQRESLGPAFRFDEEYRAYWTSIPHFIHAPFYVYAYAFGDCLVNALFATYQSGRLDDFQGRYLEMLAAGGSLHHRELLAPFGLDASDPEFWSRGLSVLEGFVDELEAVS
ncbi:M3 family oligoendopeptidase [Phaeovibrio sulfidiphilus]|uniref:M3 family oligoendopeptidase n=1 Tax=Phaeovibrio sulfidiphilus TaxID=1220600 RepID=A0A8J6YIZ2_9PROT|nr:M3 family oligoendopeptidase [Phaeovibrio sulfidiphilus]MBE1237161.1 M3 family oligoendopeptidase [Phaeovibrio sulfidiphilus]